MLGRSLDPVTEVLQSAGQRVQCIKSDGSIARSSCMSALPPIADSTQTLPELEKCHYSKHKPFKVVTRRLFNDPVGFTSFALN
jgi:hypothetical protein